MLITRKIGKVFLGGATPAQLMIAAVLGGMIGFMPGLGQAAGVLVLLTLLLVLLNANLVLAATTGMLAKAVSIPLLPVTFMIGRALLDGPAQPVFRWAINAPVLALFGFEYYATTGGLVLGALLGVIVGLVIVRLVRMLRRGMAAAEEGSAAYQKWMGKRWVRLLRWVIFGKPPKGGYKAALEARGKVIRPLGVVAAGGLTVVLVLVNFLLADEIVTMALQRGLERANGATVDVRHAELNLREGRLAVEGLAMADPEALDRNLFQAAQLTADVSTTDLLRKRLTLDHLIFNDASTGATRDVRGSLTRRRTEPSPPPEPEEEEKTIEEYVEDWERLKERLAQVRDWLERLSGPETAAPEAEKPPLRERLEQRIAIDGYARVAAAHLIEGVPTFTVRELEAQQVRAVQLDGELIDVRGRNLSTHPHLLDEPPQLNIVTTESDRLLVDLDLGGASRAGGESRLRFHYKHLPVNRVAEALRFADGSPMRDGTIDLEMDGLLGAAPAPTLDLPMNVTLHESTLRVGGREQRIERLPVTLGLRGPVDNPVIAFDEQRMAEALVEAGATQLARDLLEDHVDLDLDDLEVEGVDIGGLLGGGRGGGEGEEAAEAETDEDGDAESAVDRARGLFDQFTGDGEE